MKFNHYSEEEKREMVRLYEAYKNYMKASEEFQCAISTVYYAVNPDKYKAHLEYIASKRK